MYLNETGTGGQEARHRSNDIALAVFNDIVQAASLDGLVDAGAVHV